MIRETIQVSPSPSRRYRRPGATALASALVVYGTYACGVQEHSRGGHAAPVDTSDDFGPPKGSAHTLASGSGNASIDDGGVPPEGGALRDGGVGGVDAGGEGGTPDAGDGAPPDAGGAAMPPLSGITITLGTTVVPKEDAVAFIHFGHSNMAGRATGPADARPYFFTTDPHAWMYHVGTPPQPAIEPFTADDDTSGTYGGPGTAIVKEAAALAPGKHFISLGFGKSGAYCAQFLPGALYYDSVMQAALAIKDRVTFGAIIVMLGITEQHTAAACAAFPGCINTLVTAIRNDLGRPDLPLLITDYEMEATGTLVPGSGFAKTLIPYIHQIPLIVPNSALVPTDALTMQDDHHFDFDGHKLWVSRALQIMKDKGWFPW